CFVANVLLVLLLVLCFWLSGTGLRGTATHPTPEPRPANRRNPLRKRRVCYFKGASFHLLHGIRWIFSVTVLRDFGPGGIPPPAPAPSSRRNPLSNRRICS